MIDPLQTLRDVGFENLERVDIELDAVWRGIHGGRPCLVALERAAVGGRENLESRLARGCLRVDAVRSQSSDLDDRTSFVVIQTRAMSPRTSEALSHFARRCHPFTRWIVTDGQRWLGSSENVSKSRVINQPRESRKKPTLFGGFSDRFLSCVKALVLPAKQWAPSDYPVGSTRESVSDVKSLSRRAGVSIPHVNRFLKTYGRLGFLDRDASGIRLVRRDDLLSSWSLRMVQQFEAPVLGSVPQSTAESWLRQAPPAASDADTGHSVALGLHHAAAAHGVHVVANAPISLFVKDNPTTIADRLGIDLVKDGPANVELLRPSFPHSFWRGVVISGKGWAITDVLQVYLDLALHPRRGAAVCRALKDRYPAVFGEG